MKKIILSIFLMMSANLVLARETINVFYPYSAGATADIVLRNVASKLSNEKYNFVVIPAPGAAGLVSLRTMKNSKTNSIALIGNGLLTFKDIDIEKDLNLLLFLGYEPTLIAVNSKSNITSISDIYEEAKKRQLNYGSSGIGSYSHMSASIIANNNKNIIHVPYKTSGQAALELLAGRIDFMAIDESLFERISPNGQLRPIAANYHKRLKKFPDLKTLKEQNINNLNFYRWEIIVSDPDIDKNLLKYLRDRFSEDDFLEGMEKFNLVLDEVDKPTFIRSQKRVADEILNRFAKD